jgi:DNA oxidative demethylase
VDALSAGSDPTWHFLHTRSLSMDLFSEQQSSQVELAEGAFWLPGFALPFIGMIWPYLQQHLALHPPQKMTTPSGYPMSVKTTSIGDFGWVSSLRGYSYSATNPANNLHWPTLPPVILQLAAEAAQAAGYTHFVPDSCLINIYEPGSKMGLHQDKDEKDFSQPIVSVSLGIPATFLFGGAKRSDKSIKVPLNHGDVVVWGGPSRRFYHGITTIKPDLHPVIGAQRINLTLRKTQ